MTSGNESGVRKMEKLSQLCKNVFSRIVFIILYAPIFYLIFYSFNSGGR